MRLPARKFLSNEQEDILELPLDDSYLVTGPPGSGKTVVALYRAEMLSRVGERSMLMVHNNTLRTYLKSSLKELKINPSAVAESFHRWLNRTFIDLYSIQAPKLGPYTYDWARIFKIVDTRPPAKGTLPCMIIDEGQDMPKEFYMLTRYMAKRITVLGDTNQTLHPDQNSTIEDISDYGGIDSPVLNLTKNFRNTKQIARLAARYYTGLETGIAEMPARSGEPVSIKKYVVREQAVDAICRYFKDRSDSEVGVFLPNDKLVKSFVARLESKLGRDKVQYYYRAKPSPVNTLDFDKRAVRVMNYWHAKGLEFDAVFLPEMQAYNGDIASGNTRMLLYVLLSRARERLYISYVKDITPLLAEMAGYAEPSVTGTDNFDGV